MSLRQFLNCVARIGAEVPEIFIPSMPHPPATKSLFLLRSIYFIILFERLSLYSIFGCVPNKRFFDRNRSKNATLSSKNVQREVLANHFRTPAIDRGSRVRQHVRVIDRHVTHA